MFYKFYSDKARESAIDDITRCIRVIMSMPNGTLSYTDARAIVDYLVRYREEIEYEIAHK